MYQLLSISVAVLFVIIILLIVYVYRLRQKNQQIFTEDGYENTTILSGVDQNALINSLNDIIFEFNENKVCVNLWYNKAVNRVVDPAIFKNKTITQAIGAAKAEVFERALNKVMDDREPVTIEFPSFTGADSWFTARMAPVIDDEGNYTGRITSTVTDITQQKIYANASREKELQLIEAQSIAKIGDWWFDFNDYQTYWSDNMFDILEVDDIPADKGKFDFYLTLVHPDDRNLTAAYFKKLAKNSEPLEHRIFTPKGNLKYIKIMKGRKAPGDKGRVNRVNGILQDITESRLADKIIKKSQAELLEAQTIAKIGNWKWSFTHKKLTGSDQIYHIYDLKPQQAQATNAFKLLLTYIHHDDKPAFKKYLKSADAAKGSSHIFRIVTPKGRLKYLSIIIGKTIVYDDGSLRSIIGTLQDITKRKQAEINEQKIEDKYHLVLETIKLAALSLDSRGVITFCNQYLANLLGYSQAELIGMSWYDHFTPKYVSDIFNDWYKNHLIKSEYINPVICRNGEQRMISWQNTISYHADGSIKETTSIGEDVTEQQKDRQHLITAKEDAEKSLKFKSEFLSTMSHEIRTPMNAVIGITNLLLSDNPKPEQLADLDTLKFSGESLLGIINDILDYNKIEAGKMELSIASFNIHQLLAHIAKSFQHKASQKNLAININVDESIPTTLKGDALRLGQILNNLLSNAVKFTETGSISVIIKENGRNRQQVVIDFLVADTGIGIAEQNLNTIFEPFTQEQRGADYGGSGLGLAITKRLVELHKSHIQVSSQIGEGTRFTFSIAFELESAAVLEAPAQAPETVVPLPAVTNQQQKTDLSGMKVLVVDDNHMNVVIACRFLKRWQVETDEASDGQMAVDKFKANKYDLIIMDLQMPIMDGFAATRAIKTIKPEMPIIALTADAMPETYNLAMEAGMNDYLTKPFKQEVLFEKVARFYRN